MNRRELLFLLSALAGLSPRALAQVLEDPKRLYNLSPYGEATLLYFSDLHAQAFPHYFMEPPNLIAPKPLMGRPGYLTGEAILRYYGVERKTPLAYLLSYLDFVELARAFGPIGGLGPLAALIRQQKAQVEAEGSRALVLDGGDTWTNSGAFPPHPGEGHPGLAEPGGGGPHGLPLGVDPGAGAGGGAPEGL